ncbi:PD-(D/E)XK motif protein [Pelomonas sp. KK5]|uniref:PD-(D/E)XK motif protein n=1 Tax=Pelomonas sp. KK5 TaxID=1855730 RepID=UPI001E4E687D|nr:PD-(D/E)XK motif protein [Pelomonas sp. KK5]
MAWASLAGSSASAGWSSIPIVSPPGCSLLAARRSPDDEEAILAGFAGLSIPAAEKLPEGQGFAVERVDLGDGKAWLALTRKLSGGVELFLAMASDVVAAVESEGTSDPARLARAFLARVRAWQEFMRKGAQVLSPEKEIGLVGELAVLLAIVAAGVAPDVAMNAWVGPQDANQDFELGTGAIEVKSTISPIGFPAQIGSLAQLDDSTLQPLFLAGARLAQSAAGLSLPQWVESVRAQVTGNPDAARMFSDKIIAAGYFDAHADKYPRKFSDAGTRLAEVVAGFPRLTPGTVPLGVTEAKYSVELEQTLGAGIGIDLALKKLGAL